MVELLAPYKKLDNNSRYTMVTGGRGSAKSFHVALKKLFDTYQENRVILYTRYYMNSAKDSIIPEFKEKLDLLSVEHHFEITKTDIINKITGSRILFRGINTSSGNQTAKLKSINGLTDWVCDEAEEMAFEKEFEDIDNSIRKKGAANDITIVLNPTDKEHWIYKKFFQSGNLADTTYIHTTYKDNIKNLSESFLDKAEYTRKHNLKKFNKVYGGQWSGVEDLIFEDGYTIYSEEPETSSADWKYYGGDFGFEDPTTIIQVTKQGSRLYLKEILYKSGLTNPEIAKHMIDAGINEEITVFDSAEPKSINELVTLECTVMAAVKGADSINFGIQKLKALDLLIHKDSNNLQKEFNNYKWQRDIKTGDFLRNKKGQRIAEDKNNHCIDAVRYVVNYFYF